MNKLYLTLPVPPSINHLYGRNKFGSVYMKKEGKLYKEKAIKYIKEEATKQGWDKTPKGVYLYLDEIVYMNKSGRDSDNLKKLVQDVISESEMVWEDDTYCMSRTNRVYIDSDNPRIEIKIEPTDFKGIFDDKESYEDFILNNCTICKRGNKHGLKGQCSTYSKIMDNRIIKDVVRDDNYIWKCMLKK